MVEDTTPISYQEMAEQLEMEKAFFFWDSLRRLGVAISVEDGALKVRPKRRGMVSPLLKEEIKSRSAVLFKLLTS